MSADEVLTDAPVIHDSTVIQWSVVDSETGGCMFTDERRDRAEEWLERLHRSRPNLVLERREVRTRSEVWHGQREIVPWSSRCEWVAAQEPDGSISPAWCMEHKHDEGTPVPAEHVRGKGSL